MAGNGGISPNIFSFVGARNTTREWRARMWIYEEHQWINVGAGGGRQGKDEPGLQEPIFLEAPQIKNMRMLMPLQQTQTLDKWN